MGVHEHEGLSNFIQVKVKEHRYHCCISVTLRSSIISINIE
jgi:hypothetical protein